MSATERAQRVIDSVFAHDGKAATYTPLSGPAVACTVLLDSEDQQIEGLAGRPMLRGNILEVRKAEIAAPAKGGTFTIDAVVYKILDDPRHVEDPERLVWTMTVR